MSCQGSNVPTFMDLPPGERYKGIIVPPEIGSLPVDPSTALSQQPFSPGDGDDGRYYGKIGIIVGAIGIFIFQFIFGPLAIVLGLIATRKGERTLGLIAIVLGITDLIVYCVFTLAFIATLME